jgi:cytochrome b6-f complex iron-sulfur subunit
VPSPADPGRRSFLTRLWWALGGVFALEVGWLATDVLRPRERGPAADTGAIFVAGPVERFLPGTVTAFPAGRFYLARLEDGGFLALSRICTHLGCTVPWDGEKGRFVCPCHASSYDIHGDVLSPPAPRALDRFAVRIENGIVKVDLRTALARRRFEPEQVTRA